MRVTVPVATVVEPPTTWGVERVTLFTATPGTMVRVAVAVAEPDLALNVALWFEATRVVVIRNDADVEPAGTVTAPIIDVVWPGPVERETTLPPTGAGVANVTVPVEVNPPKTVLGLTVSVLTGILPEVVPRACSVLLKAK